jgi:REP element-mobilizing transposase RayT
MVIGYHLIWVAYGFWLPNDIRGSTSRCIRNDVIADLGAIHYGRKKVQPATKDLRAFFARAREKLMFPVTEFSSREVAVIAESFARLITTCKYTCYACAIMPDHVHLVLRKHKHLGEEMIRNFQRESHLLLRERECRDLEHPVWGGPGWKVFLDHPTDIWRTIPYVENNPLKMRLPRQKFDFVTPYDNWPLHEGHDPNSPFARAMRDHFRE